MLNGIPPNFINRLLITATSAATFALGARFGYGLDILPTAAIAAGAAATGYAGARIYSLFNVVESLAHRLNARTMNGIEDTIDSNRQLMNAIQNRLNDLDPLMRSLNNFTGRLTTNANLLQDRLTRQFRRMLRQNANVGQDINIVLTNARDYLLNAMDENPDLAESIMQLTISLNRILDNITNHMPANPMPQPAAGQEDLANVVQVEMPQDLQDMLARLAEVGQRADVRLAEMGQRTEDALNGNDNQEEQEEVVAAPILVAARNRRQPAEAPAPRRSERLVEQRRRPA